MWYILKVRHNNIYIYNLKANLGCLRFSQPLKDQGVRHQHKGMEPPVVNVLSPKTAYTKCCRYACLRFFSSYGKCRYILTFNFISVIVC